MVSPIHEGWVGPFILNEWGERPSPPRHQFAEAHGPRVPTERGRCAGKAGFAGGGAPGWPRLFRVGVNTASRRFQQTSAERQRRPDPGTCGLCSRWSQAGRGGRPPAARQLGGDSECRVLRRQRHVTSHACPVRQRGSTVN